MMTAGDLWTITIAAVIALFVLCAAVALWGIIITPIAVLVGRAINNSNHVLAQQAADFGDPTRAQVENAYGPLVLYGPSGEAYDGAVDLPRRGRSA